MDTQLFGVRRNAINDRLRRVLIGNDTVGQCVRVGRRTEKELRNRMQVYRNNR
jgi:hypothetical protein